MLVKKLQALGIRVTMGQRTDGFYGTGIDTDTAEDASPGSEEELAGEGRNSRRAQQFERAPRWRLLPSAMRVGSALWWLDADAFLSTGPLSGYEDTRWQQAPDCVRLRANEPSFDASNTRRRSILDRESAFFSLAILLTWHRGK